MALAGTHPDIDVASKPSDKAFIPVELFLGDREHRGREGMCHRIGMKPFLGGRKIAIIDDADFLNAEGANCLLKTLEEPPPQSLLILIGTSPAKQLPTIRSRCQLIRFNPLQIEVVAELLVVRGVVAEPSDARRLAGYSEGSVQRAAELADPDLWAFRQTLLERLCAPVLPSVSLAAAVSTFVDDAGKEASARRDRLRRLLAFAAEFYRRLMQVQSGAGLPDEAEGARYVQEAAAGGHYGESAAIACLDRCLDAAAQLDRNANQTTLIEAWLDDLARLQMAR